MSWWRKQRRFVYTFASLANICISKPLIDTESDNMCTFIYLVYGITQTYNMTIFWYIGGAKIHVFWADFDWSALDLL